MENDHSWKINKQQSPCHCHTNKAINGAIKVGPCRKNGFPKSVAHSRIG